MTRQELIQKISQFRHAKKACEQTLEETKEELSKLETELVLTMENEGLQSFKDSQYGTFFLRVDTFASIEDQTKAFSWLQNNGMQDVIKQTVHTKTLSAIAKENPEIEGVKITYKTQLGIRKGSDQ